MHWPPRVSTRPRGVALVASLIVIALLTLVILLFFLTAQHRYQLEVQTNHSDEADRLTQTALNLVIGQIRTATREPDSSEENNLWISQPGVLRTYDRAGHFTRGFKLYSDDTMQPSDETSLVGEDVTELLSTDWAAQPDRFVDLNEPVRREGAIHFPIVDPRAVVEGFRYAHEGISADDEATLPMPVKWLYTLKDGSLGTLDTSLTFVALQGETRPSEQNPIVGRIAFWTDDESTKVNINTAGGGVAWDLPRAGGAYDGGLRAFPPDRREWQRYPGHPATTYLSTVLDPGVTDIIREQDRAERLYPLVPRIVGGGSDGGTLRSRSPVGLVPDKDRLYPSVDEFLFGSGRETNVFPQENAAELLDRSRFFLTALSRAPETNLFNLPRISLWPTDARGRHTPHDQMLRFCAELDHAYHFERLNADSATEDYEHIPRNRELWAYLDRLMQRDFPTGQGGNFADKYGRDTQRQILTQIFDYIRCTNLHDDTLYESNSFDENATDWLRAYTDTNHTEHTTFTNPRDRLTAIYHPKDHLAAAPVLRGSAGHLGHGQVTPIAPRTGAAAGTKGFGRFYTIDQIALQLICCADGSEPADAEFLSNLPPLEPSVDPEDAATWPGWISALPPAYQQRAIRPENWNWQLAWRGQNTPHRFDRSRIADSESLRLAPGEKMVQALLLFHLHTPSAGWCAIQPDFKFTVDASAFTFRSLDRGPVGFGPGILTWSTNHAALPTPSPNGFDRLLQSTRMRGANDLPIALRAYGTNLPESFGPGQSMGRRAPFDLAASGLPASERYPFITAPFVVGGGTVDLSTKSPALTIEIWSHREENPTNLTGRISAPQSPIAEVVQRFELTMSGFDAMPLPRLASGTPEIHTHRGRHVERIATSPMTAWSAGYDGINPLSETSGRLADPVDFVREQDSVRTLRAAGDDARLIARKSELRSEDFVLASGAPSSPLPLTGDFDSGRHTSPDGAFINLADSGDSHPLQRRQVDFLDEHWQPRLEFWGDVPYLARNEFLTGASFFSPNRIVPSPVMLGSLPTDQPWKTLAFRPSTGGDAPQLPDHLLLDLFWMPVVEPYAISEPFSTAGKINLNYQILPFSYITRSTGIRALLKSEIFSVVPNHWAQDYKVVGGRGRGYHWRDNPYGGRMRGVSLRSSIVADDTLEQFETRFADGKAFKTASEICEIHLIPEPLDEPSHSYRPTLEQMESGRFWEDHRLTGDNSRERPYAHLYPRLTSRSNVFKVHYQVERLQKATGTEPAVWEPVKDTVVAARRGSTLIERFLDHENFPDFAKSDKTLAPFYRYRFLNAVSFNP